MTHKDQAEWTKEIQGLPYETPFQVTKLSKLRDNVKDFKNNLPNVELFYAVKSHSDPEVIKAIDDLVDGFDIASLGEFKMLSGLGVESSRVLFSNPVKIPDHIEKTFRGGVDHYAFDGLSELKKLAQFAPGANVYLRIKVSDYGSSFPLSKKFGADPLHAVTYMDMARDMGLNPVGLAFHVGSQALNMQAWRAAFETSGDIIKRLSAIGIDITMLDIGGGFPKTYVGPAPSMKQVGKTISSCIEEFIPEGIRIVAEPGRFVSADASVIATSVIGREHRGGEEWLFLDMGVFQGLMECLEMRDWRYPIFTDGQEATESVLYARPFTLTGPTCDAYDTIGFDYMLPPAIDVGDKVYFGAAGAYTTVYESNFNGFEPPKKYFIE